MPRTAAAFLALAVFTVDARAQHPLSTPIDAVEIRFSQRQPVIAYTLRVDSADLSGFAVELRVRNAPDTFRLAMMAHPEYDDRYWRYLEGIRVEGAGNAKAAAITREDSALWRVVAPGGAVTVRYRLRLPAADNNVRGAWRPFLAPNGGLVGGPHSFLYVVGSTLAPVRVAVELPSNWDVATGLVPSADRHHYFAPSADVLVDAPILVGRLSNWRFTADDVPHRIAYWARPGATPFDTTAVVDGVKRLVDQTLLLFGRAPYREYSFLIQDGAFGALEHLNSVTLGAPSEQLARDPHSSLEEIAHEFFHSWNLMRIRPAERGGIDYRRAKATRGLWWSEGLSMFYADLLLRRAGIPLRDSTRLAHLERSIARYLAMPGTGHLSPEQVSLVSYGLPPGALGDYEGTSVHNQGEMLGAMLDLIVRDGTGDTRSIDDVMRATMERYSGPTGFTGRDLERTVADVCRCRVERFFDGYVRGTRPIDFDRYLRLLGLRLRTTTAPARNDSGQPVPDLRIRAWQPPGEATLRLILLGPESVWGRAGLHTGDRLTSLNGRAIASYTDFRAIVFALRVGDTVRLDVARATGPKHATIVVPGYDQPVAHIEERPDATTTQRAMRARWLHGTP